MRDALNTWVKRAMAVTAAVAMTVSLTGIATAHDDEDYGGYPRRYHDWHYGGHHDWHSGRHYGRHDQLHWDPRYGWHYGEHYGPHGGRHHDWHYGPHHDWYGNSGYYD
jgi:hypothetical protein